MRTVYHCVCQQDNSQKLCTGLDEIINVDRTWNGMERLDFERPHCLGRGCRSVANFGPCIYAHTVWRRATKFGVTYGDTEVSTGETFPTQHHRVGVSFVFFRVKDMCFIRLTTNKCRQRGKTLRLCRSFLRVQLPVVKGPRVTHRTARNIARNNGVVTWLLFYGHFMFATNSESNCEVCLHKFGRRPTGWSKWNDAILQFCL